MFLKKTLRGYAGWIWKNWRGIWLYGSPCNHISLYTYRIFLSTASFCFWQLLKRMPEVNLCLNTHVHTHASTCIHTHIWNKWINIKTEKLWSEGLPSLFSYWHSRSFHALLINCVNLNKYNKGIPEPSLVITEISDGKNPPKVGWGPFLWCMCWFPYFLYRTSLDTRNIGQSWQVASQAGNGDSLASGVQNSAELHPSGLESVYLWCRQRK